MDQSKNQVQHLSLQSILYDTKFILQKNYKLSSVVKLCVSIRLVLDIFYSSLAVLTMS
jgi:hypothetical protein